MVDAVTSAYSQPVIKNVCVLRGFIFKATEKVVKVINQNIHYTPEFD